MPKTKDMSLEEIEKVEKTLATRSKLNTILKEQCNEIFEKGTIHADSTLIIGDAHFEYDYNKAMHIDYAENCRIIMRKILDEVKERKVKLIIFLGDFIGVKVGVGYIKNRFFLQEVLDFMLELMSLGALPIVLKGNHDMYQPSDYEFLEKYGFFLNPSTFKDKKLTIISEDDSNEIFFELHFVAYGDEEEDLKLVPRENISTVVLAHNNFYVRGQEEFYVTEKAMDVTTHQPFTNADMIITGDIHVPSTTIHDFHYSNGNEGAFINLGCPTRPQRAPKYDYVYMISLRYSDGQPVLEAPVMELPPYNETFVEVATTEALEMIDAINNNESEDRRRNLEEVLKNVGALETNDEDYFFTIDSLAFVNDNVKEMAKTYINRAKLEN